MMNAKFRENAAILTILFALTAIPPAVLHFSPEKSSDGMRTVHLTGVKRGGVWTQETVTAMNHGWKDFEPATIQLAEGEKIRLVLSSSDVTHSFYVPELHPEPIIVKPGHVEEVILQGSMTGTFTYYCTKVCGESHYGMRGSITVGEELVLAEHLPSPIDHRAPDHRKPDASLSFVDLGKYIYGSSGCISCHGENGKGGIKNYNYVNGEVPALNIMAERLKIYWEEDAVIAIDLLEKGALVELPRGKEPIEGYGRFLAQYHSVLAKINDGSPKVQKLDVEGPEPPLVMPSWQAKLTPNEVDAVIAYLISEFDWSIYDEE